MQRNRTPVNGRYMLGVMTSETCNRPLNELYNVKLCTKYYCGFKSVFVHSVDNEYKIIIDSFNMNPVKHRRCNLKKFQCICMDKLKHYTKLTYVRYKSVIVQKPIVQSECSLVLGPHRKNLNIICAQ